MRLSRASLLATVALTASTLVCGAQAAWWSRPAPDDTDLTTLSGGRVVPDAPEISTFGGIQQGAANVLGAGVGIGVGIVASGASALASLPGMIAVPVRSAGETVSQFAWEVAYMFGANGTPAVGPRVSEPDPPGMAPRAVATNAEPPLPPMAPVPAQGGMAASAPPVVVAVAPVAAPTPPPPPSVEPPEAQAAPLDPKLFADLVLDKARRRADGSFFVPKPLQRLFDLRTQKVETGEVALTARLPGRIVPDPNAHGDVEASLIGRIEAPRTGLPVLGEEVKQGQILGYVNPSVGVVDRTQVRREVARLTNDIRLTAESLELMKQFWFVPFRDGKIIQSEMRLEGLRRERASLLPMLQTQEALRASTDGVISVSNAINGRIVHPGDKIFEIVNPNRLWVEAIAADPDVAKTAAQVDAAVAVTPEGQSLDIGFVGSGLALQQQAVPLMFRIDKPIEGLRVGRPVTVAIRSTQKSRNGIVVPHDSVVIGSSGLEQVWEHVAPEIFVPRTVKTEAIDGRSVLITAGLSPGVQIVTRGTRLLIQLQ